MHRKISALLPAFLFFAVALPASGQVHVGLRAGANIANFAGSADTKFGPRSAFSASVYFRKQLSDQFQFVPEIGYSIKGASTDDVVLEGEPTGFEAVFSLPYVDVSAPIQFLPVKLGKAEPYIFAGPALGYRLDARIEIVDPDTGNSVTENDGSIIKYDYGALGGLGTYYTIGSQKLTAEIRYYGGLADIRDRPDAPLRNSSVGLMIGISL